MPSVTWRKLDPTNDVELERFGRTVERIASAAARAAREAFKASGVPIYHMSNGRMFREDPDGAIVEVSPQQAVRDSRAFRLGRE